MPDKRIAIIGAGPAGLATAKHLRETGLEPVAFEQSGGVGGQWNAGAPHSGIWPAMRTNTSRVTTRFSDFAHEPGLPVFPTNQQILSYLKRYVAQFGLEPHLRLNTQVKRLRQTECGWELAFQTSDGSEQVETFTRVVVASGRYNRPRIPKVKGLNLFRGVPGVSHTFDYRGPEKFLGKRVVVIGNSISGLEICSDLAALPGTHVISACRKPRYILSKLLAGRPTDCVAFSRFASLAFRAFPPEAAAAGLKKLVLDYCGSPVQYGGLEPAESVLEANISQCQNYLPLVSEGKIIVKGAPVEFTEDSVLFQDGSREVVDAVIFATGFDLHLPFLSDALRRRLDADATHLDLYQHTFHPDLPGLAFVGLFCQVGPYFPTLELQARWVALVFGGLRSLPEREAMLAGVEAHRQWKARFHELPFHDAALQFSEAAGVAPELGKRPALAKPLLFGPLAPVQFRLDGHGALPDAEQQFTRAVAEFGCMQDTELTPEELQSLEALVQKLPGERGLAQLFAQAPRAV